jgi:hypothetical protein
MEVRKIQIRPEDEARLRELLKIHETDIDSLSDDELDAAEEKASQKIQKLLKIPSHSNNNHNKSVQRFHFPLKTGTMAILAAAAVVLLVQTQKNETVPNFSHMTTKGNSEVTEFFCDFSVVGEAVTSDPDQTHFEVASGHDSFLKMFCSDPVFVHVGFVEQGMLHLELSNLDIFNDQNLAMQGKALVSLTKYAAQKSGLKVLVTTEPLEKMDLSEADRQGLWLKDVPLSVKP